MLTTINATLVWLSPIAIASCFEFSQLIWNGCNNDGCVSVNFGLCTKSQYEKRVCSAFQMSSCATTATVPITLLLVGSDEGIFATLKPYDPSANGSMEGWIAAGVVIFLALFVWFMLLIGFWIHPVNQLKAMKNSREERSGSLPTSYTLDGWPLAG
jgi:hypothetical protein